MKPTSIHLVAFNVPFPPNYGGVIDVFYKIKALHQIGVNVHLHTFQYGRSKAEELESICTKVYYYPRKTNPFAAIGSKPYIVLSRNDKQLLTNLSQDNYPIVFEGLHTTFFIHHSKLTDRIKLVRMHNIEWQYYQHLANLERNIFRKLYFVLECRKLKSYEQQLEKNISIAAISPAEQNYFKEKGFDTIYVPAFHEHEHISSLSGNGNYILYHGDLSVRDNEEAVLFLSKEVFSQIDQPVIVAGLNPTARLSAELSRHANVKLIRNPDHDEMNRLIREAHINLLFSFQSAGMKLKLINALHTGRFCVVNEKMVKDTGLEALCSVGNNGNQLCQLLEYLFKRPFSEKEIIHRRKLMQERFSNAQNAQILLAQMKAGPK